MKDNNLTEDSENLHLVITKHIIGFIPNKHDIIIYDEISFLLFILWMFMSYVIGSIIVKGRVYIHPTIIQFTIYMCIGITWSNVILCLSAILYFFSIFDSRNIVWTF